MSTEIQNELREVTESDLAAVTGGGYIHLHPTGFGARTDFMIAQKQLMESNYRGAIEAPTIRLYVKRSPRPKPPPVGVTELGRMVLTSCATRSGQQISAGPRPCSQKKCPSDCRGSSFKSGRNQYSEKRLDRFPLLNWKLAFVTQHHFGRID
jgi:hypothetical protein